MSETPKPNRLSEEKAALILDRAVQLDEARGKEIDVAELRDAATEAGISLEAFERALVEVSESRLPAAPPAPPVPVRRSAAVEPTPEPKTPITLRDRIAGVLRELTIAGAGFGIGGFTYGITEGIGLGDAGIAFGLLMAGAFAIGLMVQRRRERSIGGFLLDLWFLWVGLTFTLMITFPDNADEVLGIMSVIGASTAAIGTAAVALPWKKRRPELPEEV